MTETAQGQAVATAPVGTTPPKVTSYTPPKPYYPRTDTEFGLKWNDGEVTKATGLSPDEAIKWFMNSIKLGRIGVRSRDFYAVGVVTRQVEKKGSLVADWVEGEWETYQLSREDMLKLYKAG